MELPRIDVNFVPEYTGLSYGTEEFRSDAGRSTRIQRGCLGSGFSLQLQYEGLKPTEVGELIAWFNLIDVDYETGISFCSFQIPANHPMWDKVPARSYIEPLLVPDQTIENARWIVDSPQPFTSQILNLHEASFRVKNVFE